MALEEIDDPIVLEKIKGDSGSLRTDIVECLKVRLKLNTHTVVEEEDRRGNTIINDRFINSEDETQKVIINVDRGRIMASNQELADKTLTYLNDCIKQKERSDTATGLAPVFPPGVAATIGQFAARGKGKKKTRRGKKRTRKMSRRRR